MKLSEIKGIGMDKARALIQKASQSTERISSQIQHVIAATSKEILHKEQLIGNEKAYLTRLYEDQEQVKLLNSIKGVGVESAVILMLEIEDISRFESAKKLAAYFGVHPTFKQSGDGTWGSHMSKKGRSEVRAVLYMTALSGIRCNPLFKKIYARHRAKAMKHYQAMGVVMHKLLRIIYGILKHKTTFDPKIDEENIRKSAEKTQQMKEEKSREEKKYRYQALTTDGPLSRRAAQKRKKQIAS